jgi:hypothetical protein
MTLETRVHELAAHVAELEQRLSEILGQLEACMQMMRAMPQPVAPAPAAPPVVNVAPAAAAAPTVEVSAPVTVNVPPPGDCTVTHEWGMASGHFVPVRSHVTRR